MPRLTVARIALGCGNFGGIGSAPEFFGHWIRSRGVRPALTTKTFNPMEADADHGLAPDRIARQLRASLDRLGVDHVDLYLAHDYDPAVPLAESLAAFDAARSAGLIGGYGVSNFDARQLTDALDAAERQAIQEPQAIQNSYSLLTRRDEAGVLPLCAGRGVAYLAFSPLAGGWLTGKYNGGPPYPAGSRMTQRPGPYAKFATERTLAGLARLRAIATSRATSMAGLALAWLLADERVAQIVIGPGRPEHLAPVNEAMEQPLTERERASIDESVIA